MLENLLSFFFFFFIIHISITHYIKSAFIIITIKLGKIFIPRFPYYTSNNLHYNFKTVAPKDSQIYLSFLSYHIYVYIYIQHYIKSPFIITLEDNDTIPDNSNVPRLHNIQPFTHRLSKFTTNRNVSVLFHQKL